MKLLISILIFFFLFIGNYCSQSSCIGIPDTICVNTALTIESECPYNTQYWNFCGGIMDEVPVVFNRGTLPYMNSPVRIAVAYDNGTYYAFWTNYFNGNITKCVFGSSLRNIPVTYNLGNIDSMFISLNEGIQIIKENGKWYAFIVGSGNKFFRLDFGNSLNNVPVGNNFGTIGNMSLPHGLYMFKEEGIWIGLVANAQSNSFTRIIFPDSLTGVPVATNSGVVPGVSYPTSIYPIKENDSCYAFVTSKSNNQLFKFNFGNSYFNTMMNVYNYGNIGALNEPFDIAIIRDCNKSFGIISNKYHVAKMNMPGGASGSFDGDTLFYGSLNRVEGISNSIRQGDSLYYLLVSAGNRLTVISFGTCSGNPQNYNGQGPVDMTFNSTGQFPVSLFVNEGEYDQVSECMTLTVIPRPSSPVIEYINDTIFVNHSDDIVWYFGDEIIQGQNNDYIIPTVSGMYYAVAFNGYCYSDASNIIDVTLDIQNGNFSDKFSWYCYFNDDILIINSNQMKCENMYIEIFDLTGKQILTEELNVLDDNGMSCISLNERPKGILFVKLTTERGSSVRKVINW
ncbi:MAG: T9SS type A sorting domain-containing protein [Bacteroidota bacterium]